MSKATSPGPRAYRSALREQQAAETRSLVLSSAIELFADRGWSGTSMRDVATRAGVAVETVYSRFKSKSELLLAAIDAGVVGDADPAPLSARAEFAALGTGEIEERLAAAARLMTQINERSWRMQRALAEAAVGDPQLAEKRNELEHARRDNLHRGMELMRGTPLDDDKLDALWVLAGTEAFHLLTQVRGLSVDGYQRWVTGLLRELVAT